MNITIIYGNDLELGERQFPDLDVTATRKQYASLVANALDEAFPDAEIMTDYDPHRSFTKIAIDPGEDDEIEDVRQIIDEIETRAAGGEYGEYAITQAEEAESIDRAQQVWSNATPDEVQRVMNVIHGTEPV